MLLESSDLDLDLQNKAGECALWLSLQHRPMVGEEFSEKSLAGKLVARGASVNTVNSTNGVCKCHIQVDPLNWHGS